jgi:1-deoxy-D-xylulose 5-phosphate reductoisomerase
LREAIRFDQIAYLVDRALQSHQNHCRADFEGVLAADRWARDFVKQQIAAFT